MAYHQPDDKSVSGPMMVSWQTHICVTLVFPAILGLKFLVNWQNILMVINILVVFDNDGDDSNVYESDDIIIHHFQTSYLTDMDTINTGYHWRLLISIGLLLLTSHTQSQDDAVFAHEPPTITLADWPLYPKLPASLLATVDKVVITSFNPGSYQSPHALLVTKHGRVYLYGKSPYLGLGRY